MTYFWVIGLLIILGLALIPKFNRFKAKRTEYNNISWCRPKGALYYDDEAELWVTPGYPYSLEHFHWWLINKHDHSVEEYQDLHADHRLLLLEDYKEAYYSRRE